VHCTIALLSTDLMRLPLGEKTQIQVYHWNWLGNSFRSELNYEREKKICKVVRFNFFFELDRTCMCLSHRRTLTLARLFLSNIRSAENLPQLMSMRTLEPRRSSCFSFFSLFDILRYPLGSITSISNFFDLIQNTMDHHWQCYVTYDLFFSFSFLPPPSYSGERIFQSFHSIIGATQRFLSNFRYRWISSFPSEGEEGALVT